MATHQAKLILTQEQRERYRRAALVDALRNDESRATFQGLATRAIDEYIIRHRLLKGGKPK